MTPPTVTPQLSVHIMPISDTLWQTPPRVPSTVVTAYHPLQAH